MQMRILHHAIFWLLHQEPLMGFQKARNPTIKKISLKMGNVRLYLVITNKTSVF
jgi:hypothetical protein